LSEFPRRPHDLRKLPIIDIHQHLWTEPLVQALARRRELPFVRIEHGLTVLFLAGERPYVIDLDAEAPSRRTALVELDGLDRALLCLSSPLGIEALPRTEALPLIDAYHDGALALGDPFGVWGAVALDRADPADVDHALARGCVGISLPAGALASVDRLARLRPLLARLEIVGAPLLVHPGPGYGPGAPSVAGEAQSLDDPLWWPALTHYVASMQAAWLAFLSVGRSTHPELRIVFSMLAGLAPLHGERLLSRGGPDPRELYDPLLFYDTSSYGPATVRGFAEAIGGAGQLLYGSDRPVVEPGLLGMPDGRDRELLADAVARAFGSTSPGAHHGTAHGAPHGARQGRGSSPGEVAIQALNVPVARVEALR
jgi:hypothetical protein